MDKQFLSSSKYSFLIIIMASNVYTTVGIITYKFDPKLYANLFNANFLKYYNRR